MGTVVEVDASTFCAVGLLIVAAVLVVVEMSAPGLVFVPFAGGAVVGAVLGFAGAPPVVQLLVTLGIGIVLFVVLRPVAKRLNAAETDHGVGARRFVGVVALAVSDIDATGGFVQVERERWQAQSDVPIPEGTRVEIREVRGTRLIVTPSQGTLT